MTDRETIDLGLYCEALLQHEHFNALVKLYEKQKFDEFIATKETEKDKREVTYASCKALMDFIGLMIGCVSAKDEILKKLELDTAPSETDAQEQDFED